MNKQEKLAREWAEKNYPEVMKVAEGTLAADLLEKTRAAAEYILATTAPLTMADVVWDDMEHRGMVGVGEDGVEWVMLYLRADGRIIGVTPDFGKARGLLPKWLTPTGKRYEFREVTEPGHPEVLKTVKDYANAPEGTLAASSHGEGYFHNETMSRWESTHGDWKNYVEMESSSYSGRTVLRWGWGGEA